MKVLLTGSREAPRPVVSFECAWEMQKAARRKGFTRRAVALRRSGITRIRRVGAYGRYIGPPQPIIVIGRYGCVGCCRHKIALNQRPGRRLKTEVLRAPAAHPPVMLSQFHLTALAPALARSKALELRNNLAIRLIG